MDIFESFRRAMFAGMGVPEKLKEVVEELVKKGELSETQASVFMKEWADKAEQSTHDIGTSIKETVDKAIESIPLAMKDEVKALRAEVQALEQRIKALEGK